MVILKRAFSLSRELDLPVLIHSHDKIPPQSRISCILESDHEKNCDKKGQTDLIRVVTRISRLLTLRIGKKFLSHQINKQEKAIRDTLYTLFSSKIELV